MKKPSLHSPISTATCVFLVLLRLAIGWHLFIEGASKLETFSVGLTGASKPFSSRGYLLQSQGPLSPYFRKLAGDPDELLVTLIDSSNGAVPAALQAQWRDYVQRYCDHYQFDQASKDNADALLNQHLAKLADWFSKGAKEVSRDYPFAAITPVLTTAERIAEYRRKLQELHDKIDGWNLRFEKDVTKARVAALKGDVARLRTDLQKDLDDLQGKLAQDLDTLLTKEQENIDFDQYVLKLMRASRSQDYSQDRQAVAELIQAARDAKQSKIADEYWQSLNQYPERFFYEMKSNPEMQKVLFQICKRNMAPSLHLEDTRMLDLADRTVAWGLTLAGLGLLLGCFTRLSCVTGAILLLLFYLALPPLPGLPDNPMAEGKYLFVNKNLIEALALLALATTASGRWFGFDGLLSLLIPFKYLWPRPQLVRVVELDPVSSAKE
ncbi:MAG TPA: hypothetical protein PLN21_07285 [Gemmatales bacterium]|nr:hypothetical protein [Gemmatales bacterium]